jgi:hypothetical protein
MACTLLVLAFTNFNTAVAQSSPIAVDVFGSFGRGFADGERISWSYGFRPVYDFGAPVNIGTEFANGPTMPADWSVLLDIPIISLKFGVDTSKLAISVKAATVLNEGTEVKDNWFALTFDYKPNKIQSGIWTHLSIMGEPALRLIENKPDYFIFRSGLRYSF